MNAELTIVIPTHNRKEMLLRLLRYYHHVLPDTKIIIVDSSDTEIYSYLLRCMPSGSYDYYYFNPKSYPSMKQFEKMAFGASHVTTPYIVFCPDDDVISPSFVLKAVDFLTFHGDYVSVTGIELIFESKNRKTMNNTEGAVSISEDSSIERIEHHMRVYHETIWSVRRTSNAQEVFSLAVKHGTSCLYQIIWVDVLTAWFGKIQHFKNDPWFFRRNLSRISNFWYSEAENDCLSDEMSIFFSSDIFLRVFNAVHLRFKMYSRVRMKYEYYKWHIMRVIYGHVNKWSCMSYPELDMYLDEVGE